MSQRSISANHFKIALFFSLIFLNNNNKVFVSFRLSETHNTVATPSVSDQSQFVSNYNDMDTDLNEL